jgi:hypothetical protein
VKSRSVTSEQRTAHGGDGPMTPEPVTAGEYTFCDGK